MATKTASQFEITYTYHGEKRPVFAIEADSPEEALNRFKAIKPGVPVSEIQNILEMLVNPIEEAARLRRAKKGIQRTAEIQPTPISDEDANFFQRQEATIRFLWAPFLDTAVKERFVELGRALPANARPIETGKLGGSTELWNVSCEVSFPSSETPPAIPFTCKTSKDGRVHIYDLGLGLELYCNRGFECKTTEK